MNAKREPHALLTSALSKDELERQKLELEIAELRGRWNIWGKRAALCTGFLAAFGGVFGVLQLYFSGYFDIKRERLELETIQLEAEKTRLKDVINGAELLTTAGRTIGKHDGSLTIGLSSSTSDTVIYTVVFLDNRAIDYQTRVANHQNVDKAMTAVATFPDETDLTVSSGFVITNEGLSALKDAKHLRDLHLDECPITDEALRNLKGMKKLRSVSLSNCNVTGTGLVHLDKCERLESLMLDGCKLNDHFFGYIHDLRHVKSLSLRGAKCSTAFWSRVTSPFWQTVTKLDFSLTEIDSSQLTAVTEAATSVEEMGLYGCKNISDDVLSGLLKLHKLKLLTVAGSGISKDGIAKLREGIKDCVVSE